MQRVSELKECLLRAGVAPRHVRRYLRELSDHFDDLKREEMAKGANAEDAEAAARARLGTDATLAQVMLARPELKSLAARHPLAVLGFGPVLMLVFVVVGAVFLEVAFLASHLALLPWLTGSAPATPPYGIKLLLLVWNESATYLAPLVIAGLVCLIGLRQRMAAGWIVFGAAMVCILGGFHEIGMRWSDVPGRSELSVGFAIAPPFPRAMIMAGFVRAVLNLVLIGAVYGLLQKRFDANN